ncbi:MAG: membrane protein insertase YidC [Syntrophorhabdaceae bacterium]|nr:membrane protein insertase YidC [Syntrophorhabdaceae bacterium]
MDKRTIIALILTFIILFIFQTYFAPQPQKQNGQTQIEQQKPKDEPKGQDVQGRKDITKVTKPLGTDKGGTKKQVEIKPPKDIVVETPLFKTVLSDLGGGIKSVKLKKYKETVKEDKGKEVIEDTAPYGYLPKLVVKSGEGTVEDRITLKADRESLIVKDKPETITFTGHMSDGKRLVKTYTFFPDTYVVEMKVEMEAIDSGKGYLYFTTLSNKKDSGYNFKGPFYFNGKKLEQIENIDKPVEVGKDLAYLGMDEGYFAFIYIPSEDSKFPATFLKSETGAPLLRINIESSSSVKAKLFFGPKQTDVLKSLNIKAERIIDFGWFDIIAKPLVMGLNYSNKVTKNYGIDIILLTILIKIIFYPLTVKSSQSMKKMQKLQPQIQKLREKYKDDRQKLNQEMMDLYRRQGVNPMGGCLPMIIQIPVFFALYKALSGAIELRHAHFFLWIDDLSSPEDLFSITVMGYSFPIRILPLIMGITQVIQQKMTPTSMDPMQEKMMLLMPIVFTFLFWGFPSGLVLYWLVNNVISIGQQYYINKKAS